MVADVGYEEKLKKDVQKFNARLQNLEKATKIGEYFRKKTECYLHDYSAELSRENEMKSLNMKKYHLLKVTKTLHSTIETNQKAIAESNEKLKLLEKQYKILQPSSSSPSPHKSRIKKRIEYISKKHFTLEKQKCSNSTLLLSKINNLKTELNYLKQDEMEISLQIDSKYEFASEMQAQRVTKIISING